MRNGGRVGGGGPSPLCAVQQRESERVREEVADGGRESYRPKVEAESTLAYTLHTFCGW